MIRIQRRRTRGWRMPEGAVYVGRPSLFGNPWGLRDAIAWGIDPDFRWGWMVARYRLELDHLGLLSHYGENVSDARWQAVSDDLRHYGATSMAEYARHVLRGKDLVCWCPLDQPCHADVLLELANR